MNEIIEKYLSDVRDRIKHKKYHSETEKELKNHIQDVADSLISKGTDADEAVREAVMQMGSPAQTAEQLNAVYGKKFIKDIIYHSSVPILLAVFIIVFIIFMPRDAAASFFGYMFSDEAYEHISWAFRSGKELLYVPALLICISALLLYGLYCIMRRSGTKHFVSGFGMVFWASYFILLLLLYCEPVLFGNFGAGSINMKPFDFLYSVDSLLSSSSPRNIFYAYYNFFGNILAFVPFMPLAVISHRKTPEWRLFLSGIAFSVITEVIQIVCPNTVCDIDDVILSVFGLIVGWCLCRIMLAIKKSNKKLLT